MAPPLVAPVRVAVARDARADLIPRLSAAGVLAVVPREAEVVVAGGVLAGPVMLDLDADGRLVGASALEERRDWARTPLGLALVGKPHRVEVLDAPPMARGEVRWDPDRRLVALVLDPERFDATDAPRVVGLGPRAHAALDGDALLAVLADLRGFAR